ncbi:MAG: substrate-binding domain-containing protein [Rhodoferax sp.]|uniref:ABC transporter substrate-binding protein n=1 Tax=Rhodoferax sp. TaxID=50421 RepID=UPI003264561D
MPVAHAAPDSIHIVFIPKSSDQVFWELMRAGVDRAVQEDPRIKLTWRGPAHNDDTEAQIKIVQLYTKPGVDAIVIAPTDRARLVEPVKKAVEQGIPVISVDSGLDGNYHVNFVTSDNEAGGQLAAKTLAGLLNKTGRVAILRTVEGSASTDDRARGFLAYMKASAPGISVVADVYGGGSAGLARHSAAKLLAAQPPLDGVFAVNESATDGMLRALREAGLAKKLRFIGFDSTEFLLTGLEKQEIDGLVIQNPRQMGYLSVKAAVDAVHHVASKNKILFTDTSMVTRANYKSAAIQTMMCSRC